MRKTIIIAAIAVLALGCFLVHQDVMAQGKAPVGLQQRLYGSAWTIENKAHESGYNGTTGTITFSDTDNTFVLDEGSIAAMGITDGSSQNDPPMYILEPIEYELLGQTGIYVVVTCTSIEWGYSWTESNAAIISTGARNQMIWMGLGGMGSGNTMRGSVLTRTR